MMNKTSRWNCCRYSLGLILLLAACLKAIEIATLPFLAPGLLNQRWLLAIIVEVELVLGFWLLFGKNGYWVWVITLNLWIAFTCVSAFETFRGVNSCGCFGQFQMDPRITFGFDFGIVLILPFCRPAKSIKLSNKLPLTGLSVTLVAGVVGVLFGIWSISHYSSSRLSQDGLSFVDDTVILEPQKWIGHTFPLAQYIDIGPSLMRDDWIVLLYRSDCEHCRRAVPRYQALDSQRLKAISVAIVEMPPYASVGQRLGQTHTTAIEGRLNKTEDWFAATPVAIRLQGGVVKAVAERDTAEDPTSLLVSQISSLTSPK